MNELKLNDDTNQGVVRISLGPIPPASAKQRQIASHPSTSWLPQHAAKLSKKQK